MTDCCVAVYMLVSWQPLTFVGVVHVVLCGFIYKGVLRGYMFCHSSVVPVVIGCGSISLTGTGKIDCVASSK